MKEAIQKEISDSRIRYKEQLANAMKRSGCHIENAVSEVTKTEEAPKHHNHRRGDGGDFTSLVVVILLIYTCLQVSFVFGNVIEYKLKLESAPWPYIRKMVYRLIVLGSFH